MMHIAGEKNGELKDRILNSPSKNENAYHLSGNLITISRCLIHIYNFDQIINYRNLSW